MSTQSTGRISQKRPYLAAYLQIIAGCAIGAAGFNLFLTPHSIAPGGLTGVATIINFLSGLPIGAVSILLNMPLFVLGWRTLGRIFAFRSLIATLLFSVLIDILPLPSPTDNPLLAVIYGGVIIGFGFGLVLRGGATTGGTDMIARMLHHRFPSLSVGTILFAIDCAVILSAAAILGLENALYAMVTIFIMDKVIDAVLVGFSSAKACFVMSERWEDISARILHELDRGCTQLSARGAYTRTDRPVLLCVVSGQEIALLKAIVSQEDPAAFMFISDAQEALGEGFSPWSDHQSP